MSQDQAGDEGRLTQLPQQLAVPIAIGKQADSLRSEELYVRHPSGPTPRGQPQPLKCGGMAFMPFLQQEWDERCPSGPKGLGPEGWRTSNSWPEPQPF